MEGRATAADASVSLSPSGSQQGPVGRREPVQGCPAHTSPGSALGRFHPQPRGCWFRPDVFQSEAAAPTAQLPGQRRHSRRVPGVRRLRCPPAPSTSGPSSGAWSVAREAPPAPGTPCPTHLPRRAPVSSAWLRLAASRPGRRCPPASAPRALSSSSPPPRSPRFARSGPRPGAAAAPLLRRRRQLHRSARLSPASAQPPPASSRQPPSRPLPLSPSLIPSSLILSHLDLPQPDPRKPDPFQT